MHWWKGDRSDNDASLTTFNSRRGRCRLRIAGTSDSDKPFSPAHEGSVTDKEIAEITRRSAEATRPSCAGIADTYRALIPQTDDYTLMSPFGGTPTRNAEMTSERWEAIGRFFRNGTFEQELVQSYASADMVVLAIIEGATSRPAVCRPRTGRCASPWFFAMRGPNGGWRIGMLTRLPRELQWNRRPRSPRLIQPLKAQTAHTTKLPNRDRGRSRIEIAH